MTIAELLGIGGDATLPRDGRSAIRCPRARDECRGQPSPSGTRARRARERDDHERRLGGEPPDALVAARARRPARVHGPELLQGWGSAATSADGTDAFRLARDGDRWALDLDELDRAVDGATKVVMVCNPNNPTGRVLTEAEMDAVVAAAERVGAWLVADEIYRGAEVDDRRHVADVLGPLRQGRRHVRAVEGVRDARAADRLGRSGPPSRSSRDLGPPRLHDADAGR